MTLPEAGRQCPQKQRCSWCVCMQGVVAGRLPAPCIHLCAIPSHHRPSFCSELDRHAATLAQLADELGAQLTPRSHAAYGRIEREFDRLIARVGGFGGQCKLAGGRRWSVWVIPAACTCGSWGSISILALPLQPQLFPPDNQVWPGFLPPTGCRHGRRWRLPRRWLPRSMSRRVSLAEA